MLSDKQLATGAVMRRFFGLLLLLAMLVASLYVLYMQAFVSPTIKGEWLLGAGFFATFAIGSIWVEFIAPLLRGKSEEQ